MMRAKMQVMSVIGNAATETVSMAPVCGKPFDADGNSEDNTFATWSPSGSLSLSITNPNLIGKFKEGQKFYLDFTESKE